MRADAVRAEVIRADAARVEAVWARAQAARAKAAGEEPDLLEAQAVLEDPAPRAERAPLGDRTLIEDHALIRDRSFATERPRAAYVLGVAGGAALALSLGGLLFLALPSDHTALTVLLVGVVAWTTVVLLSFRLQSRR